MFGPFSNRYTTENAEVFPLRAENGMLRNRCADITKMAVGLQRDFTELQTRHGHVLIDIRRLEESLELAKAQVKEAGMIIAAKDTVINRQDEENARLMALLKHFNIVDMEAA